MANTAAAKSADVPLDYLEWAASWLKDVDKYPEILPAIGRRVRAEAGLYE